MVTFQEQLSPLRKHGRGCFYNISMHKHVNNISVMFKISMQIVIRSHCLPRSPILGVTLNTNGIISVEKLNNLGHAMQKCVFGHM